MSEYLDKAKRFAETDDGPTPLALIAIAERLTRIADMMAADRKPTIHHQRGGQVMSRNEAARLAKPILDGMKTQPTPLTERACAEGSPHGYYGCSLIAGHRGDHVAQVTNGDVVDRWRTPLIEEPPVGSMVTRTALGVTATASVGGSIPGLDIFRRADTGWHWWTGRGWGASEWDWDELVDDHVPHLTTDVERKAAGIPLEDWLISEPAGSGSEPEDLTAAAHRAAKAAGLVAVKPAPGATAITYRRAASIPYYEDSIASDAFIAIADAIEAQEGIG